MVNRRKWLTSDELCEYYAISSSLPGVIAVNTSIFTGRKLLGTQGAVAATIGIVLPSFLAIVLLASILNEIVNFPSVQHIFWGVGIGVIALLFLAVGEMWKTCIKDGFSFKMFLVCLIFAIWGKFSPAWIIIAAVIVGIFYQKSEDEKKGGRAL